MELGNKIRQLRCKASLTQEQLAEKLGLSAQSVSKWETGASMPDISLLPMLSEVFGVSIDELFDLTKEQKLRRIESRLEHADELSADVFREYEDFLQEQLEKGDGRKRALSLLAQLYHQRMEADAQRVSRYAREAMRLAPEEKDCQWLLQRSEGAAPWDWNAGNHADVIDFYKELIANDAVTPPTPLPYYYLLDQLIADHRTDEAEEYLARFRTLPAHKPFMAAVYAAHIALARYDEAEADRLMEEALRAFPQESGMLFEAAQYHARKCEYDQAIALYEASFAAEEGNGPRFTDALDGIARIHEIRGDIPKAVEACDRMLTLLRTEWGFTDEAEIQEVQHRKDRLLNRL